MHFHIGLVWRSRLKEPGDLGNELGTWLAIKRGGNLGEEADFLNHRPVNLGKCQLCNSVYSFTAEHFCADFTFRRAELLF